MDSNFPRKQVHSFSLGNHVDVVAVFGELFDPAVEETEDRIIEVNCLRNDEKSHVAHDTLAT